MSDILTKEELSSLHTRLRQSHHSYPTHQVLMHEALKKITHHLLAEALEKHEHEQEVERLYDDPDLLEIIHGGRY